MFFPERITNINPTDKVLEVGPGGLPHPRSDVFLELKYENLVLEEIQRGFAPKPEFTKPIHYYDGGIFPFSDKEFDYIICSHVLEHVDNLELFISELNRVSSKGYLEYPTVYYDYIYNIPSHINLLKKFNNEILYIKKKNTKLHEFESIQKLFYCTLENEYYAFVDSLKNFMFEGFEWNSNLIIREIDNINELTWFDIKIVKHKKNEIKKNNYIKKINKIFKKYFRNSE